MRTKKISIIISVVSAILSLIVFTISVYRGASFLSSKTEEWIKAVSAGVFTSSLVTLLISIGEYYIAKKNALETFYRAERILLSLYKSLKYLHTLLPIDYLQPCLHEEMLRLPHIERNVPSARQAVKDYLWNVETLEIKERVEAEGRKDQYLEKKVDSILAADKSAIDEVIQKYLAFKKKANIQDLVLAFSEIDFMFDNNDIRKKLIKDKILKEHMESLGAISELCFHLQTYEDAITRGASGNLSAILSMILEKQEKIFETGEENGWAISI